MSDQAIDFEDLVGQEYDFYGCDEQRFKLDDQVYEVVDGEIMESSDRSGFHELPIARVVIEADAMCDEGYEINDLHDGHCWLNFGFGCHCWPGKHDFFEYTPKDAED